jgi:hypothetical protein
MIQRTFFENYMGETLPLMGVHEVITIESKYLRMAIVGNALPIVPYPIYRNHIGLVFKGTGF